MRITSWNCLCRDVSRRLSDLAPLRSDLITLQECRRALGVPVFGGVGPPVAACATIAGRFVSVARARAAAHRRAVSGHCRPRPRAGAGGPCPPYAVPRRTRRRGDAVRGAAGPAAWDRRRAGTACACCARYSTSWSPASSSSCSLMML